MGRRLRRHVEPNERRGRHGQTSGVDAMYAPYIEGEMELVECNRRGAATTYVKSDRDRPSTGSCIMGQ